MRDWQRFRQSFNAVYGLQPDMLQIGFLKLLPGTKIRRKRKNMDIFGWTTPPYEILSNNIYVLYGSPSS